MTGDEILADLKSMVKRSCKKCHETGLCGMVTHQKTRRPILCTCVRKHPDFAERSKKWKAA